MKITPEKLKTELQQYTGCEQPFFNPLYRWLNYTDGAKAFAELAEAYWFLDYVGFNLQTCAAKEDFIAIQLDVDGETMSAVITITDGNENLVKPLKKIGYTDCPAGVWKFYLVNDMLMLPREY